MTRDTKARHLAQEYKQKESDLLQVLIEMDANQDFASLGYTGLYDYCFRALKLGEAQSYYFAKVARKSQEVPALKTALDEGRITLSKARRIVPVLTPENSQEWITKAELLPQRELERAVTVVNPKAVRETLKPVTPTRTELRVGIPAELEKKLRRLQDLLGGSLEDVLEKVIHETLERHDPVAKVERAFLRKRQPAVKNAIHWRDGQCTVAGCTSTRFLEVTTSNTALTVAPTHPKIYACFAPRITAACMGVRPGSTKD